MGFLGFYFVDERRDRVRSGQRSCPFSSLWLGDPGERVREGDEAQIGECCTLLQMYGVKMLSQEWAWKY